jgi:hypothetical protein
MTKQLIIVDPTGALRGLDHKRRGVDLRQFGRAEIERATLIEWDSQRQGWYIKWCSGGKDNVWGVDHLLALDPDKFDEVARGVTFFHPTMVLFKDYEDAIAAEVAIIQQLQKTGSM